MWRVEKIEHAFWTVFIKYNYGIFERKKERALT